MSALEFGKPRRRFVPGRGLVYLVLIVVVIAGGYVLVPRFEWRRPEIKITPDTDTVGLAPLQIAVTEQGTGLKSFTAVLISGGTEYSLAAEQYDQPLMQKNLTVALSSKLTGLKEGPAVLRVTARDRSLWNFFRGNESVVQKNLIIDITPPSLELIADDRYCSRDRGDCFGPRLPAPFVGLHDAALVAQAVVAQPVGQERGGALGELDEDAAIGKVRGHHISPGQASTDGTHLDLAERISHCDHLPSRRD